MPKKKFERCTYCYKKFCPDDEDHYLSGKCVKAQEVVKAPKPPKGKKTLDKNFLKEWQY